MLKLKLKTTLCFLLCTLLTITQSASTFAKKDLDQPFLHQYGQAGAVFYNPDGTLASMVCTAGGNNNNYIGDQVLTDAQLAAVTANQSVYQTAADQYGFPWQILAAIHYAETSLRRYNPDNGQGVYQLYSYTNGGKNENRFPPADSISEEEFARQTGIAASIINGYITSEQLDTTDGGDVMRIFYRYNGVSGEYYNRAIKMGFSEEEAHNGAGSTYVMNRYDAQRDPYSPNVSPYWKGRYTSDGHYEATAISYRFGTFVVYEALGATGVCDGLVAGGMTYEQAVEFMEIYKQLQDEYKNCTSAYCSPWRVQYIASCGTAFSNCVGVSQYFVNRYTTIGDSLESGGTGVGGLPDGHSVVSALLNRFPNSFIDGGTTPRPYAIFSTGFSAENGHTGVVLGIDEEAGLVYTGEAGCGNYNWTGVKTHTIESMSNGSYVYAYTDQILKTGSVPNIVAPTPTTPETPANPTDGSNILIIGDSITVGSSHAIHSDYLSKANISAEDGRQFTTGINILKSYDLQNIDAIVFALGTNNTNLLSSQINQAIEAAGGRKIFFVNNYKLNSPSTYEQNNQRLLQAAADNSNVYIIDWAGAVSANPSAYVHNKDGYAVHPTAAGQQLFASLIYQALLNEGVI